MKIYLLEVFGGEETRKLGVFRTKSDAMAHAMTDFKEWRFEDDDIVSQSPEQGEDGSYIFRVKNGEDLSVYDDGSAYILTKFILI